MTAMIVYDLPLPPSTNNLFSTGLGRKRYVSAKYNTWRKDADRFLMAQGRLEVISGPVQVRITIRDDVHRDLDNCCKAILDFLVSHGIIEDDRREIVRSIFLTWGKVSGARVEICRYGDAEWVVRRNLARAAAT